jgi:Family of unknown function (DUF5335)
MTQPRIIPRAAWRPFFDSLSNALVGKRAEIEASSLDLGDQVIAEWLPLVGITYDSHNDLLDVSMQGKEHFSHLIRHPHEIVVIEEADGVKSIAVNSVDGVEETIRFKAPLMLPEET